MLISPSHHLLPFGDLTPSPPIPILEICRSLSGFNVSIFKWLVSWKELWTVKRSEYIHLVEVTIACVPLVLVKMQTVFAMSSCVFCKRAFFHTIAWHNLPHEHWQNTETESVRLLYHFYSNRYATQCILSENAVYSGKKKEGETGGKHKSTMVIVWKSYKNTIVRYNLLKI